MSLALPVGETLGCFGSHTLPPDVALGSQRSVGEYGVSPQHVHCLGVRGHAGARSNSEETSLWVDRAQASVGPGLQPGDVVAEGFDLPPGQGGRHHGKVCFATGARECSRQCVGLVLWAGDLHEQHVLSEPSFLLSKHGGDAQGKGFLGQ